MNRFITLNDLKNSATLDQKIKEIVISAELSKADHLKNIFLLLKENKLIKKVSICDDYLDPLDVDTQYFCKRVIEESPKININWIRELKIDGRHGR
jgi:poly(3-hydroxyalkanoate) synthetase